MTEPVVYSVKEFNTLVSRTLLEVIGAVTVAGEVSNFQIRQQKWVSFDLKDAESVVNCFTTIYRLDLPLADGQAVHVTGTPTVYVPYGKYSLGVYAVELKGQGALQKAFDTLKSKLETEGLFDRLHKRPLPRFPETVGIVTSRDGAAVNDIIKIINERWGGLKLFLYPVTVQGKNAPADLVDGLDYFNRHFPVDVIIFGRGGGSLEDLQAFNSERVARAIFASRIPIVAGIGHEPNTSIADLVADVRASTPSNAAVLAVSDRREVAGRIANYRQACTATISQRIATDRLRIRQLDHSLRLFVGQKVGEIRVLVNRFGQTSEQIKDSMARARTFTPQARRLLALALNQKLALAQQRLSQSQDLLGALSHDHVLGRGYSITFQAKSGKLIRRLADLPPDGRIKTQVTDGSFKSTTQTSPQTPRH